MFGVIEPSRQVDNLRLRGAPAVRSGTDLAITHRVLRDEMLNALTHDPQAKVWVPAYTDAKTGHMPAAEVVQDMLSSSDGDAMWHDILKTLGAAARGEDVALRAQLIFSVLSERHATYHADDGAVS